MVWRKLREQDYKTCPPFWRGYRVRMCDSSKSLQNSKERNKKKAYTVFFFAVHVTI